MSQNWPSQGHQHAQSECARAVSLLDMGQTDNALAALSKATADDATDFLPLQLLGAALMVQGRYPEALDSLKRSYALKPSNETILTTGLVYFLQRDYDAALNAYNKILQFNPHLSNVFANIGMAFLRKGEFQRAREAFSRLATSNPNSQLGYYGLALVDYETGNFQQAIEQAQRAESIHSYPPAILLLAELDYLCGNSSRASKEANRYISFMHKHWHQRSMTEIGYPTQHDFHFDPYLVDHFDNGYFLLARMEKRPFWKHDMAALGHLNSALEKAESAQPHGDWQVKQELGILKLTQGDYSSAAEAFKSQLNQCADCKVALLYLAQAYSGDGQSELASGAVRDFQKALPAQQIAEQFRGMTSVDPALKTETQQYTHSYHSEQVEQPQPSPSQSTKDF